MVMRNALFRTRADDALVRGDAYDAEDAYVPSRV